MPSHLDFAIGKTPFEIASAISSLVPGTSFFTPSGREVVILDANLERDHIRTQSGDATWPGVTGRERKALRHAVVQVRRSLLAGEAFPVPTGVLLSREQIQAARALIHEHSRTLSLTGLAQAANGGCEISRAALYHLAGCRPLPTTGKRFGIAAWQGKAMDSIMRTGWILDLEQHAEAIAEEIEAKLCDITLPADAMPPAALRAVLRVMQYPFQDMSSDRDYDALITHEHNTYRACLTRLATFAAITSANLDRCTADQAQSLLMRTHPEILRALLSQRFGLKLNQFSYAGPSWGDVLHDRVSASDALRQVAEAEAAHQAHDRMRAASAASKIIRLAGYLDDHAAPHIATVRAYLRQIGDIEVVRNYQRDGWLISVGGYNLAAPSEEERSPWACQALLRFVTAMADDFQATGVDGVTGVQILSHITTSPREVMP